MTRILLIDTSGDQGLVALSGEGRLLASVRRADTRDHAAVIHQMTEEVLAAAGCSFADLHAVAVCAGPGSYTGLRIGMAVAKGFCYALGIPLLLQNKLTLLAHQHISSSQATGGRYAVILPARAGEYFAACYDAGLHPLMPPQHITDVQPADWPTDDAGPPLYVMADNPVLPAFLTDLSYILVKVDSLDPEPWGLLALRDWETKNVANLAAAAPFYMKDVFIKK
jgi:tRNA threonylcarbamoyladenosine biosynthesis protein TsaB